jgi:hypothetical protein
MQVPPPSPATIALAQKLSDPPFSEKVQHLLAPVSVQSAGWAQRRTVWLPVQLVPSEVAQSAAALQATVSGPVVQLGMVPPVMGMFAQQTGVLALVHCAGESHT